MFGFKFFFVKHKKKKKTLNLENKNIEMVFCVFKNRNQTGPNS